MKEVETMSKIAVVYWSGTGNTEAMANEVAEGAKAAGAEVDVLTASEFGADKMDLRCSGIRLPGYGSRRTGRQRIRANVL